MCRTRNVRCRTDLGSQMMQGGNIVQNQRHVRRYGPVTYTAWILISAAIAVLVGFSVWPSLDALVATPLAASGKPDVRLEVSQ